MERKLSAFCIKWREITNVSPFYQKVCAEIRRIRKCLDRCRVRASEFNSRRQGVEIAFGIIGDRVKERITVRSEGDMSCWC